VTVTSPLWRNFATNTRAREIGIGGWGSLSAEDKWQNRVFGADFDSQKLRKPFHIGFPVIQKNASAGTAESFMQETQLLALSRPAGH